MANPHPTPKPDNLKPFRKGQSGNPAGRSKGAVDLLAILNEHLVEVDPATKLQAGWELMAAMLAQGKAGNVKAAALILERLHGKPESRMETALYQEHVEVAADQAARQAAELAREEQAAAEHKALIDSLMGEYPLSREQAEDLLADLDVAYAKEQESNWSLTDELKSRVLGVPIKPKVSHARKDEIIHEILRRHGLLEPEPDPEPPALPAPPRPAIRSGFVEIPTPAPPPEPPWPDSELAAAAVDTSPEVKPEPPAWPPVLEGEYFEGMPGFSIKIDRKER